MFDTRSWAILVACMLIFRLLSAAVMTMSANCCVDEKDLLTATADIVDQPGGSEVWMLAGAVEERRVDAVE